MAAQYGSLPFKEAISFLENKLDLPTRHWLDIRKEAHDTQFVVAGATDAALIADLHAAVLKAKAEGKTVRWFNDQLNEIVAKHGWHGWTGEDRKPDPMGIGWRARTIYETNMRTAYSAGRYQQVMAHATVSPFLRYWHSDAVRVPRPVHQAWGRKPLILRIDHPMVKVIWPPNGWGCKCKMFGMSQRDIDRYGWKVTEDFNPETYDWLRIDRHTGELLEVQTLPVGVDPGWDYAPGASLVDSRLRSVSKSMDAWPEAIREQYLGSLPRHLKERLKALMPDRGGKTFIAEVKAAPGIDPELLKDEAALARVREYATALGSMNIVAQITQGGISGSATLAHELAEIASLERLGVDIRNAAQLAAMKEAFWRAKVENRPELAPWHLDGLRAEIAYTKDALAQIGISASQEEVAAALYYGMEERLEFILKFELEAIGITLQKAPRKDLIDALSIP